MVDRRRICSDLDRIRVEPVISVLGRQANGANEEEKANQQITIDLGGVSENYPQFGDAVAALLNAHVSKIRSKPVQ